MEYGPLNGKCPIWSTRASTSGAGDGSLVASPRSAGQYSISGSAIATLLQLDEHGRARLTTWLVEQRMLGNDVPNVSSDVVSFAKSRPSLEVFERAYRLLDYFNIATDYIGEEINFDPHGISGQEMLAVSESINFDEIIYLIEYLREEGFIDVELLESGGSVKITMAGYSAISDRHKKGSSSDQAFVAMWFDPTMNDAYEHGVAPGVTDSGYRPVRIDKKNHNNKIDDEIISEIRRSRFLIADFTQSDEKGARGGVYYEAGFAHGLNIPVIFTCRADAISRVHFDTRQYNHITWKDPTDLRHALAARISATIGDGPHKRP